MEKYEDAEAPARCRGADFHSRQRGGAGAAPETGAEAMGLFIAFKFSIWPMLKRDGREGRKLVHGINPETPALLSLLRRINVIHGFVSQTVTAGGGEDVLQVKQAVGERRGDPQCK